MDIYLFMCVCLQIHMQANNLYINGVYSKNAFMNVEYET